MKVNIYSCDANTGILNETSQEIDILKNRWVDSSKISHPLKFTKPIAFSNDNVYFLYRFGVVSQPAHGEHISLSFIQNQRFLFMQKLHWIQKEENIRYVINILFLIGGLTLGVLNYLK